MFIDYDFYSAVSVSSILFKKKGKKRRQKHRKDKKNLDNLKIIFRISKSFLKKLFFQSSLKEILIKLFPSCAVLGDFVPKSKFEVRSIQCVWVRRVEFSL